MDSYINMPPDQHRVVCEQASSQLGLPPATIEKDFWVCWMLDVLFGLPEIGKNLTFKGGTSLSKGWDLIYRFSEDIDIVIGRNALGFGGENSPEQAPSTKQKRKRLKALRVVSQKMVKESISPALSKAISQRVPGSLPWQLDFDADDPDDQTLLFTYPTAFSGSMAYLRKVVKIEFGARSDTEPTQEVVIRHYLGDVFPDLVNNAAAMVRAVSPERTFLEKAMLLHEETFRPPEKKRKARMARHYYDLYCLINAGIGAKAAFDIELFDRIAMHRQVYFAYAWVDYETLRSRRLRLVPGEQQMAGWRNDYNSMRDEMFFREPPSFEEIMRTIRSFEKGFSGEG